MLTRVLVGLSRLLAYLVLSLGKGLQRRSIADLLLLQRGERKSFITDLTLIALSRVFLISLGFSIRVNHYRPP